MASPINISAMIQKKAAQKSNGKHIIAKDTHRDLTIALLGISVFGKEARDEEIMEIIINCGQRNYESFRDSVKSEFDVKTKSKEWTKGKKGFYKDSKGFTVLAPKM